MARAESTRALPEPAFQASRPLLLRVMTGAANKYHQEYYAMRQPTLIRFNFFSQNSGKFAKIPSKSRLLAGSRQTTRQYEATHESISGPQTCGCRTPSTDEQRRIAGDSQRSAIGQTRRAPGSDRSGAQGMNRTCRGILHNSAKRPKGFLINQNKLCVLGSWITASENRGLCSRAPPSGHSPHI